MYRVNFNPAIYFVLDPSLCAGRKAAQVALAAAKGGVTMIQYRNKSGNMSEILAEAGYIAELLKPFNIPFLINDYVDVAFAVGAHGVHLGQGDASPQEARAKLDENAIIGQTVFTEEQIAALDPSIVDYIGTGPFYPTKTDKGKPVLGAQKFAELVKLSPVPVVGIGGITPQNAPAVIKAGAQGVAMMRSMSEAGNVEEAARSFQVSLRGTK